MKNITEKQFKNFRKSMYRRFEHIFVRLDEQDNMIGLLYKKFDLVTEEVSRLNREVVLRNDKMDAQIRELKEMNSKMDARIANLEEWRTSVSL